MDESVKLVSQKTGLAEEMANTRWLRLARS